MRKQRNTLKIEIKKVQEVRKKVETKNIPTINPEDWFDPIIHKFVKFDLVWLPETEYTNKLGEEKLYCFCQDDYVKCNHGKCNQSKVKQEENADCKDVIWACDLPSNPSSSDDISSIPSQLGDEDEDEIL